MIITCPHCQTKYQVTYDAIGSAGRKVQCAHCHRDWKQAALPPEPPAEDADRLFSDVDEDLLDEALAAEAEAVAAEQLPVRRPPLEPQTVDAAELHKRQKAFSRRHNEMVSQLPLARLRRSARMGAALLLVAMLATAYFARVQIVDRYPSLAGLYQAIGLGVNVVGLDFANVQSGITSMGGRTVLSVSAQIVGLRSRPSPVPPVVVTLFDASGKIVYQWSAQPRVPDLMAGERATFDTRLSDPPESATRVQLTFGGGERDDRPNPQPDMPVGEPPATSQRQAAEPAPAAAPAAPTQHH
ncbi:zinc-ribbon domain-containing protein [Devosia sp. PTR5]|uniref:Zinc-ribbon domain-containing protein n=1 Tax=Devosia oryzisoli TaxID=2774138 RepID=A0A927FYM2_9HYPH|nr:MJ0042-type zinc finger domain-containing protein [Devosia oryzisoli]MBD8067074.1 zinc-ribbon domain-containing protein [Devosia oryzisoli]